MSAPQMFERKNKRMHTLWQPSHTKTENDSKEVQHQYTQHTVKLFLRAPLHIKSSVYALLHTVSRLSLEQEDTEHASEHLDRLALHVSARAHLHLHRGPNTASVATSENAPNMSCVYSRLYSVPVDFDPEQRLRDNCPPVAFSRTGLVSRVIKSRSL
jgi:hypothetical protein